MAKCPAAPYFENAHGKSVAVLFHGSSACRIFPAEIFDLWTKSAPHGARSRSPSLSLLSRSRGARFRSRATRARICTAALNSRMVTSPATSVPPRPRVASATAVMTAPARGCAAQRAAAAAEKGEDEEEVGVVAVVVVVVVVMLVVVVVVVVVAVVAAKWWVRR